MNLYALGRRQGQADALLDVKINLQNAAATARAGGFVVVDTERDAEIVEAMATVFDATARQFGEAAEKLAITHPQWEIAVGGWWERSRARLLSWFRAV